MTGKVEGVRSLAGLPPFADKTAAASSTETEAATHSLIEAQIYVLLERAAKAATCDEVALGKQIAKILKTELGKEPSWSYDEDAIYKARFDKVLTFLDSLNLSTTVLWSITCCLLTHGKLSAEALRKKLDCYEFHTLDIDQRIELCNAMARKLYESDIANKCESLGFLNDFKNCTDVDDRLALARRVCRGNLWGHFYLIEHAEKLGLDSCSPSDRLLFWRTLAETSELAASKMIQKFKTLGLDAITLDERISLIRLFIKQGDGVAREIPRMGKAIKFDEIPLDTRLELAKLLINCGEWSADGLCKRFECMGLHEASFEQRLELCKQMVRSYPGDQDLRKSLSWRLEGLGFLSDIQDAADDEQRYQRCLELCGVGGWAVQALLHNIDKIDFTALSEDQQLSLWRAAGQQGCEAATAVLDKSKELVLQDLSLAKRLVLLNELCRAGGRLHINPMHFSGIFPRLGLIEASCGMTSLDERLAFCLRIAKSGAALACGLSSHLSKMGLDEATAEQRFEICKVLAKHLEWATEPLIENLDTFGLTGNQKAAVLGLLIEKSINPRTQLNSKLGTYGLNGHQLLAVCGAVATKNDYYCRSFSDTLVSLKFPDTPAEARLSMYKAMALAGDSTGQTLARDFLQLDLDGFSPQQRLDLATTLAENSSRAADVMGENFAQLGFGEFSLIERIALCNAIGKRNTIAGCYLRPEKPAIGITAAFSECKTATELLFLCTTLAAAGPWSAEIIIKSFRGLTLNRLNIEQRFKFLELLATHGHATQWRIAYHFEQTGFIEDLQKCDSPGARLQLCRQIFDQGDWGAMALARHFGKLGLNDVEPQELLALLKDIAAQLPTAASALVAAFADDALDGLSASQRLELCTVIASHDDKCTEVLLKQFHSLKIQSAKRYRLRRFYRHVMVQGVYSYWTLAKHWHELGIERGSLAGRLRLYTDLSKASEDGTRWISQEFQKLGLVRKVTKFKRSHQRAARAREIAAAGDWAGCGVILNIEALKLDRASSADRFALFQTVAQQGDASAAALAEKFKFLNMDQFSLHQRLELCQCMAQQGAKAVSALLNAFDDLGLKDSSPAQRLALAQTMATFGGARELVKRLWVLKLEDADPRDYGRFCLTLAHSDYSAAKEIAKDPDAFSLGKLPMPQRLAVCRQICVQSFGSSDLLRHLDKLGTAAEQQQIVLELLADPVCIGTQQCKGVALLDHMKGIQPYISLYFGDRAEVEKGAAFFPESHPLHPVYSRILSISDSELQLRLRQWVSYSAGALHHLDQEQRALLKSNGILLQLLSYRNPHHRYPLLRYLSHLDISAIPSALRPHAQLCWIAFKALETKGFSSEWALRCVARIHGVRGLRDSRRLGHVMTLLLTLCAEPHFNQTEIQLLQAAIETALMQQQPKKLPRGTVDPKSTIQMVTEDLRTINDIWHSFGKKVLMKGLENGDELRSIFTREFQALFDLPSGSNDQYQSTFAQFRDSSALLTYLGSVMRLPASDRTKTKAALSQYVQAVLEGKFKELRYDPEQSPHLKLLFEHDATLKAKWLDAAEAKTVEIQASEEAVNYREFFFTKIILDKHLPAPENHPALIAYLNGAAPSNPSTFETIIIDLCEEKVKVEEAIYAIGELDVTLGELKNDLKALLPNKSSGTFVISESDDPCDLLLIGTEVRGSCQRVGGSPSLNKNLVGYLLNGEILPIVAKQQGKIAARAILRLLWDEEHKRPVLLLERIYSNVSNASLDQEIFDWAKAKAAKMGLPLTGSAHRSSSRYEGTVICQQGLAPFTYSDAAGGSKSGKFEVGGLCTL